MPVHRCGSDHNSARSYSLCAEQARLCCFSANGDIAPGNHRLSLLAGYGLGVVGGEDLGEENCRFCRECVGVTMV